MALMWAPLVNAELDRRYADRAWMRPADRAGFREAWHILERLWGETVERTRANSLGVCVTTTAAHDLPSLGCSHRR
jgi:hypothetical protein